jgi:hypothetical protein
LFSFRTFDLAFAPGAWAVLTETGFEEESKTMADGEGSGNTGVVAIVVIFLIVVIAAFFAWRGGMFGGGSKKTEVDVNVTAPSAPATK